MGVYAVLRKTWSHSTVTTALSFPEVSAVLQVHVGISLSLLNGTEIWHGSGWGLGGVSCRDFGVTVVPRRLMPRQPWPVEWALFFLQTETSHERVRAVFWPPGNDFRVPTITRTNPPLPPPIMIVCIMEDANINTVINQALKLAVTRSRMPFLPKQRGRHLLALPRHSQSMSKVLPLFDTAVCCRCRCRRARGAEEEHSHVRKCIHNTDRPLVFCFSFGIMCSLVNGLPKIPPRKHLGEENTQIRLSSFSK